MTKRDDDEGLVQLSIQEHESHDEKLSKSSKKDEFPIAVPAGLFASRYAKLAGCVGGIMGFFILYGILQERIMTTPYGSDPATGNEGVYFEETTFLVFSNRVVAVIIAVATVLYKGQSLKNMAPLQNYAGVSLSNFSATYCQYEALKYVNFPTQTLGKCGKMLPVMLVGQLISKKKYTAKDYSIAVTITLGCMIFYLFGEVSSKGGKTNTNFGLLLMALYMFFDSFTSTSQEKMFAGYPNMSTQDQIIYVSGFSAIISVLIMIVKGTLFSSISFSLTYTQFMWDSTMLSLCSTLGQMIIYYTIKEFGALFFSTVMVTRQVFSVFISTILFRHPLTNLQFVGCALVFGALYYKANEDKKKKSSGHGRH